MNLKKVDPEFQETSPVTIQPFGLLVMAIIMLSIIAYNAGLKAALIVGCVGFVSFAVQAEVFRASTWGWIILTILLVWGVLKMT